MNELNIDRLTKSLSDILSRKHGAKITIKVTPKPKTKEGADGRH